MEHLPHLKLTLEAELFDRAQAYGTERLQQIIDVDANVEPRLQIVCLAADEAMQWHFDRLDRSRLLEHRTRIFESR